MKVITLGTGAAVPTLRRGHPAVALWWDGNYFLFDCGEGTQIQYRRAGLKFSRLSAIFISHLHGDHILGIMGFLMSLELAEREKPLKIYGPAGIEEYIETSKRLMCTVFNFDITIHEITEEFLLTEEGYTIRSLPLDHRVFSLGYSFTEHDRPGKFNIKKAKELGIPEGPLYGKLQKGEDVTLADGRLIKSSDIVGKPLRGRKFVYCGDTRPCENVIKLADRADLLIYEGTFDRESREKAKISGHSTTEEAAEIAKKSGVKKLIVNHISSRYQDEELLLSGSRDIFPRLILARDLMEVEIKSVSVDK
ncbi:MAG: ribonuclease Z [Candidatus Eremiobacterota bacterium]